MMVGSRVSATSKGLRDNPFSILFVLKARPSPTSFTSFVGDELAAVPDAQKEKVVANEETGNAD